MIDLKKALAEDIAIGLEGAGFIKPDKIVVEKPDDPARGQYASPIGFALAKRMKKQPAEIVEAIVSHMPKKEYIGRIEGVGGFLNISLNPGWMMARLDNVITDDLGRDLNIGKGRSVNLEFISANPTGPMTLANSRAGFYADTLANVFQCVGYNVTREYYVNDAGGQVRRLGESVMRRILEIQGEKIDFPEDLYRGEYIKDLASRIAEETRENEGKEFEVGDLEDKEVLSNVSERAVEVLLGNIKQDSKEILGIDFDVWTSEKYLRETGQARAALTALREKGVVYKKDGAEWLKTSAYGDSEDRVVVKSDGDFSYLMPDIAYHRDKYEREYDKIFTFVGVDHQGLPPRLYAAMEALGYDKKKLEIILVGWMHLARGGEKVTMSKRAGEILTPKDLIDEVGYDAARFGMISHAAHTTLDFDLDSAKEKSERNPVYYVQYAYVRLQSILRKAKEEAVIKEVGETVDLTNYPPLTHTLELRLMEQIYRWPEVVSQVAKTHAVHELVYYARDLATAVHAFYKNVPVLKSDKLMLQGRLQLVLATRAVLGKMLDLLGVAKPEVM